MNARVLDLSERENQLGDLLATLIEAAETGRILDRTEWMARHPEFATELDEFFDSEDRLFHVAAPLRAAIGAEPVRRGALWRDGGELSTEWVGRRIGDYDVLAEIGRGGMGVVYKARQVGANRIVALKLLRADPVDGKEAVRRFRNEAETVARLDHPNIVPLYEVGEYAGRVYFSMRFVEGGSLASALADRRLPVAEQHEEAARLVAMVARAVHHAHQRGVLHRDLKPANILLDGEEQPYVTDFGLARRLEVDSSLTQTGAVVGTPSYMAPEQASGNRAAVTTATDVYGLGAVLYTLLAGRPPFLAGSVMETLALIQQREAEPPSQHGSPVNRDLETVCLKCLHKEPQHRYPSAEALAADLERWLKGEPIEARPLWPLARLGRWCRRNPVVAGSAATTTCLLVLTLVGLTVGVWLLWREQAATQAALVKADAKNRWARRAVNEMYAEVAEEWLGDQPDRSEVHRRFLRKALEFYEELAREKTLDPQEQFESGKACRRLASIQHELEPTASKGQESGKQAAAIFKDLVGRFPNVGEFQLSLCQTQYEMGQRLIALDRFSEAEVLLREAADRSAKLVCESPDFPEYQRAQAASLHILGELFRRTQQLAESEVVMRQSVTIQRALSAHGHVDPDHSKAACNTYRDWALVLLDAGRFSEAVQASREALPIIQQLVARRPRYDDFLASTYHVLGTALLEQGQLSDAQEVLGQSVSRREQKKMGATAFGLAMIYSSYGRLMTHQARYREAESYYRKALTQQVEVVNGDQTHPSRRQELALMYSNLGWVYAIGPVEVRDASKALPLIRLALAEEPDNLAYRTAQGVISYRLGEWDRALNALQSGVEWKPGGSDPFPRWKSGVTNLRLIAEHNARTAAVVSGFFLAMCHHRRGDNSRAREQFCGAIHRARVRNLGASCWVERVNAIQAEAAQLLGIPDRPAQGRVSSEKGDRLTPP